MLLLRAALGEEIAAVAHRLDEDKSAVEDQRDDRDEHQLRRSIGRPRRAFDEIGQNERQHRHRDEHVERRGNSAQREALLAKPHPAAQQAEPDDAVDDDHDRREHGIARQRRGIARVGQHQADDQRHLDHRHRHREDQRAERLANLMRPHLGMMHRGEHAADQDHRRGDRPQRAELGEIDEHRDDAEHRKRQRPPRQADAPVGRRGFRRRGAVVGGHRSSRLIQWRKMHELRGAFHCFGGGGARCHSHSRHSGLEPGSIGGRAPAA